MCAILVLFGTQKSVPATNYSVQVTCWINAARKLEATIMQILKASYFLSAP